MQKVVRIDYDRRGLSQRGMEERDRRIVLAVGRVPILVTADHRVRSLHFRVDAKAADTLVKRMRWLGYGSDIVHNSTPHAAEGLDQLPEYALMMSGNL
jgi:hypothetical protein